MGLPLKFKVLCPSFQLEAAAAAVIGDLIMVKSLVSLYIVDKAWPKVTDMLEFKIENCK